MQSAFSSAFPFHSSYWPGRGYVSSPLPVVLVGHISSNFPM